MVYTSQLSPLALWEKLASVPCSLLLKLKRKWKSLSCVWLFATPWIIQSMEFYRPECWSGWHFPSPGDLPNPGIEPRSPTLQMDSLPAKPQGKPEFPLKLNSLQSLWLTFFSREVIILDQQEDNPSFPQRTYPTIWLISLSCSEKLRQWPRWRMVATCWPQT